MSIEIERKFVADAPPPADVLGTAAMLRQGYLAQEGDVAVRIRFAEGAARLTIKAGAGLVRTEVELPLGIEQAEALWPHTAGRRIVKQRFRVPIDGLIAEVDLYEDQLRGLCTVEVEFDDVAAAHRFQPPSWFGREVTRELGWSNAELARHGRPDAAELG